MMKLLSFAVIPILFGISPIILGQGITGSATIGADPNTDIVSATCETDTDGDTLGVYKAVVRCSVLDSNGNSLAYGGATDTSGFNGYAQVILTFTGVPGTTYTVIGTYLAMPIIRQRLMYFDSQPYYNYYDDLYYLEGFMIDGSATYQDVPSYYWYGPGPETPTNTTSINLGSTTESVTVPYPCPTSLVVDHIYTQPLQNDFPNFMTGVGMLTKMLAGPYGFNFNSAILTETVTPAPGSNSCPVSSWPDTDFPFRQTNFVVGLSAFWEGSVYPSISNAFYDAHTFKKANSALAGSGSVSCISQAMQTYTCNGNVVGIFYLTATFYKGFIGATPVTFVTTSKQ